MQGRREGPFPQTEVLRWADQLCDALDYLHTQDPQIIHRDIKPQNLKLSARGQIVLLDFGLAKGSAGQMSVVTTSASIFGYTPNYAPLEQVQGLGTDPRSDIYALAATLYHLMTNIKPPDALSRASSIVNGLPDPLAPADSVSAQVSRPVASVLEKAMSQKRDDRYASAEDMREALRVASTQPAGEAATVLTSAGVATDPNTVTPVVGTHMAGQQTNAFGYEARTLVADDGTQVPSQPAVSETATVVRPASTQSRSRLWMVAAAAVLVLAGVVTAVLIRRALKSQSADVPSAQNPIADPAPATSPSDTVQSGSVESKTENPTPETANPKSKPTVTVAQPRQTDNTSTQREGTSQGVNRNPDRQPSPPEPPVSNPPVRQFPPRDQPPVQTFPNGTRIETRPDGTRIITFPGGRTRVIPPGGGPPPRRRRPN
jgi:serine/threonine protein kinase